MSISSISKDVKSCEHRITVADDRSIVFDREIPNCQVHIGPEIGVDIDLVVGKS